MEFGLKRVIASVRVVAALKKIYHGEAITVSALSRETKLSESYLEQIFSKLRKSNIVRGQKGPGGGYHLCNPDADLTIASIIRAVTTIPAGSDFEPVLTVLDTVLITQLSNGKITTP